MGVPGSGIKKHWRNNIDEVKFLQLKLRQTKGGPLSQLQVRKELHDLQPHL